MNFAHLRSSLLALGLATGSVGLAQAAGHYVPGVEGVQAASVPPPGVYYLGYLVNYSTDAVRAPGGSANLPGDNSIKITALANRFVWVTPQKVLGADYGVEAIVPVLRTSVDLGAVPLSDTRSGIGDVYVGPVVLGWHGAQWDAVAAAGVWLDNAPSGQPASPGQGYRSTMFTLGSTAYADASRTTSASVLMRYEVNGGTSSGFKPGNTLSLEWGVGRVVGPVTLGLVGYGHWQVSNDTGIGATSARAGRAAFGVEVSYPVPGAGLFLKAAAYKETVARAGSVPEPKGTLLRATLVKAF